MQVYDVQMIVPQQSAASSAIMYKCLALSVRRLLQSLYYFSVISDVPARNLKGNPRTMKHECLKSFLTSNVLNISFCA